MTIDEIIPIVLEFARGSTQFISPNSENDPIVPALSSLTNEQFGSFFFALLAGLSAKGIKAKVPLEMLRHCQNWGNVCVLIDNFQV